MEFIKKHKNIIIICVIIILILLVIGFKLLFTTNEDEWERIGAIEQVERNHKYKFFEFGSDYCSACDSMEDIVKEITEKYKNDIDFEYVDVNDNLSLTNKYNVNYLPEFIIVDENGDVVTRKIGAMDKQALDDMISGVLNGDSVAE